MQSDRFASHGYVPQAFTHGTLHVDDSSAASRFLTEVLGLEAHPAYTKVVYAVLSVVCYQSDPIYHTKPIWTSIDSWQYGVDQGANWQGNAWRPATYHYYPRYN